MRDKPASRYESIRKLREQAALYNLLATNGITTMQQLHEKVDAMNAQYYKLRGEIVSAERRIATLEERLDMFEKYEKNKAVQRQYVKVKPAKREQFEQSYRAELTLYKAAVRYLENLKTEGEPVTPKKWRSEVESLTAQKNLQYQEMRAMREEIKAVEKLKRQPSGLKRMLRQRKRNETNPNAEHKKAVVQNHFHTAADVISRKDRYAFRYGLTSAPALHLRYGRSAANREECGTRGVPPSSRSKHGLCAYREAFRPLQAWQSLLPAVRFSCCVS